MRQADGIRPGRAVWLAPLTGAGFLILGYGSVLLSGPEHMVALIWPGSAFALSMLARLSRSRLDDLAALGAIFLAQFTLTAVTGASPVLALGFAAIAAAEVLVGLAGLRRFAQRPFRDLKAALTLALVAAVVPSIFGALLAAGVMALAGNGNWATDSLRWFSANFLGFCIILPFGLTVSWRRLVKLRLGQRWREASLVFLGLTLVSLYALIWAPHPIPSIILPAALVATVRFRLLGAGVAMFLVLAIVLTSGSGNYTPNDLVMRIDMMQIFLAVTSIVCTRAAMLLNERDLHIAIIEGRKRRAVNASRFKSQLLAHVGQEARGPLSAILGISTMLESGKVAPERAQEFAHIVAHNGELLQRLYEDLSDLAEAQSGALSIQPESVAVGETLKTCVEAIRLDAALGGKPLLLGEIEDSLCVRADPQRLAQIINHLIANSYKYGDNHSPIRVRASRQSDGFGRIEILNSGPGIAPSKRRALFEPFENESGGRQVPGAGLGLSLAKLLAERQGGRIDCESIPGRQTRFWIDLPLAA
jgi:signal transduction histidine kinase